MRHVLLVIAFACACVRPPDITKINIYRHMSLQDAWSTAVTTTAANHELGYISPATATVVTRDTPIDGAREGRFVVSLMKRACISRGAHIPCRFERYEVVVTTLMIEDGHVVSGWDVPDDARTIGVHLASAINTAINGDDNARTCHRREGLDCDRSF